MLFASDFSLPFFPNFLIIITLFAYKCKDLLYYFTFSCINFQNQNPKLFRKASNDGCEDQLAWHQRCYPRYRR